MRATVDVSRRREEDREDGFMAREELQTPFAPVGELIAFLCRILLMAWCADAFPRCPSCLDAAPLHAGKKPDRRQSGCRSLSPAGHSGQGLSLFMTRRFNDCDCCTF